MESFQSKLSELTGSRCSVLQSGHALEQGLQQGNGEVREQDGGVLVGRQQLALYQQDRVPRPQAHLLNLDTLKAVAGSLCNSLQGFLSGRVHEEAKGRSLLLPGKSRLCKRGCPVVDKGNTILMVIKSP